ncbi:Gfo/Idh/MocA family oxidoreductase [Salinicoccus jeotgali]|uniref:Gfo/Idh/MocA family oxidoreductase n=1 Tax=Salinicoccus jeotgali TaxID=381634 RepID=A0ABP7E9I8_9STAP
MKIATIGTGFIVDRFLDAVCQVEGVEATAVYSRRLETAEAFGQKHDIGSRFTDMDAMLKDEAHDTVYIASPNSLHHAYAKKAIEAGKHVICEKPFTSTAAELKELIDLAGAQDVFLFEAVTGIHLPHFKAVQENMKRIGDIRIIQANYSQYSSRYEQLKHGQVTNVFNLEFSGGALADLNIYNLHFVIRLLGRPDEIVYLPNKHDNGADTSGVCVLKYDGCVASCIGSKDTTTDNSVLLQGNKGYIRVNGSANIMDSVDVVTDEGKEHIDLGQNDNNMVAELESFRDMLSSEDRGAATELLEHSMNVMEAFEAARSSADIQYPADEK